MNLRVLSFDFEGCLFHSGYHRSSNKDVIAHNEKFLLSIASDNASFDSIITLVGSVRQSYEIDCDLIKKHNGSCFPAIKKITDYLNDNDTTSTKRVALDPFLLADAYGKLADGVSFNRATDPSYDGRHSRCLLDSSCFTLLLTQMHRVAAHYPDATITFDFYNAGSGDLKVLNRIFSIVGLELIPHNVTLCLNSYAGGEVTPLFALQGKGGIIYDYRSTFKKIMPILCEKPLAELMSKRNSNPYSSDTLISIIWPEVTPEMFENIKSLANPMEESTAELVESKLDEVIPKLTSSHSFFKTKTDLDEEAAPKSDTTPPPTLP